MSWIDQVGKFLKQQTAGGAAVTSRGDVDALFDQVTKEASPSVIAEGLAAAFRSKETSGFGNLLATLFTNSTGEQKAGMLNQLMSGAGPAVLSKVLTGAGLEGLVGTSGAKLTPDQAQKLKPEVVQELAMQAEKANPSIVETLSGFYAQHGALLKTLGGTVLTVVLAKIAQRQKAA
jgi:hypothetical protein